jgi:hypothetical protein
VVSFFKYRQCLITAPIIPTACLRVQYTKYVFTRSVHQLLAYASGALTNQGGRTHQYIDHVVCFNTRDSHHLNKHMILHVFRARGYDLIVPLSWYRQ